MVEPEVVACKNAHVGCVCVCKMGLFLCLVEAGQHCTKRTGHEQIQGSADSGKLCVVSLILSSASGRAFRGWKTPHRLSHSIGVVGR